MSLAAENEGSCRTVKNRGPDNNIEAGRMTDVDLSIAKKAYWDLALKKFEGGVDIGHSAQMSFNMALLEKMLENLPRQPESDLIFIDTITSEDFTPLKRCERKFKEQFRCGLRKFLQVINNLPVECKFSPAMEVFIECCREFDVAKCLVAIDGVRVRDKKAFAAQIRALNSFYRKLKARLSSSSLRKKISDHCWKIENNYRQYQTYVDALFQTYARLVVIRLDLEYCAAHKPSLREATSDLDRFFSNQRHNKIFSALRGFIVKVEFGIYTGYHFHVLMFFDGSKRRNNSDVFIAEELGEYWKGVATRGKGHYWNVNKEKQKYAENGRLGIGTIHAYDALSIKNLKVIVRYFCKKDQFFKPVSQPKFRNIRKGGPPVSRGKKLGRPRGDKS